MAFMNFRNQFRQEGPPGGGAVSPDYLLQIARENEAAKRRIQATKPAPVQESPEIDWMAASGQAPIPKEKTLEDMILEMGQQQALQTSTPSFDLGPEMQAPIPQGPSLQGAPVQPQGFDYQAELAKIQAPPGRPQMPQRGNLSQVNPLAQILGGLGDVVGAAGGQRTNYLKGVQGQQQGQMDTQFQDQMAAAAMKWEDEQRKHQHALGMLRERGAAAGREQDLAYRGRREAADAEQRAEENKRSRLRNELESRRVGIAEVESQALMDELQRNREKNALEEKAKNEKDLKDKLAKKHLEKQEWAHGLPGLLGIKKDWDFSDALMASGFGTPAAALVDRLRGPAIPTTQIQQADQKMLELWIARTGGPPPDWKPGMPVPPIR